MATVEVQLLAVDTGTSVEMSYLLTRDSPLNEKLLLAIGLDPRQALTKYHRQ